MIRCHEFSAIPKAAPDDSGQDRLEAMFHREGMLGSSSSMLRVFRSLLAASRQSENVIILGPCGSGKTLAAGVLHRLQPSTCDPLVAVSCAAPIDDLTAAILGPFEGSSAQALPIRQAGGTLVLEDVTESAPEIQNLLLHLLKKWQYTRGFATASRLQAPRIIATSGQDVRAEVLAGRFREDLYYRLAAIPIHIPSLAARAEDIIQLASHMLAHYGNYYGKQNMGLTHRAQRALYAYSWPGNVRELENVLSRAVAIATTDQLDLTDLDLPDGESLPDSRPEAWKPLTIEAVTREHIFRVLEFCGGNRVYASRILGIGRTSLYRFLQRERRN